MSDLNWCQNKNWNDSIERSFMEKLRRARHKGHYLRIQASTLASSHPEVALRLLDQFFALGGKVEWAQGYYDRATALFALGRVSEAIAAYEDALAREAEFPSIKTYAYLDLPFLIATTPIPDRFDQAERLLEQHKSRLTFPVDRFRWYAAAALIAESRADTRTAAERAAQALAEAHREHSGFHYHPDVGLVSGQDRKSVV